jgi:hypothetical protein
MGIGDKCPVCGEVTYLIRRGWSDHAWFCSYEEREMRKITVSLSQADYELIAKIKQATGAYTSSEVVRDALRDRYKEVIKAIEAINVKGDMDQLKGLFP